MDSSTPGFTVHHQLPELTQTLVHWVSDAIQPSQPLLPLSPPAFNLSQHEGLSQWVSSSHQVAKVLELQLQISPSVNIQDWFPLEWTGWISCSPKNSQESSPIPQLKNISSLALSFLYCSVLTSIITGKTIALTIQTFVGKVTSLLFNILSRFAITFLPRIKYLLISWLPWFWSPRK